MTLRKDEGTLRGTDGRYEFVRTFVWVWCRLLVSSPGVTVSLPS